MNRNEGEMEKRSERVSRCVPSPLRPLARSGRSAFTLVELIVVMFMLVVMMAVAAPSFVRLNDSSSLRASARTLLATFRYARSLSVTRRTEVRVLFKEDRRNFQILTQRPVAETGEYQFVPERTALGVERKLPAGITVSMTKGLSLEDEHLVAFHPNGSADEAVFTLTNRRGAKLFVTLMPVTGRVSIESDANKVSQRFSFEGR